MPLFGTTSSSLGQAPRHKRVFIQSILKCVISKIRIQSSKPYNKLFIKTIRKPCMSNYINKFIIL